MILRTVDFNQRTADILFLAGNMITFTGNGNDFDPVGFQKLDGPGIIPAQD